MVSIYIEAIESAFQISMFVYLCLPMRMRGTAHVENNLLELVLSSYHVDPRTEQSVRFGVSNTFTG